MQASPLSRPDSLSHDHGNIVLDHASQPVHEFAPVDLTIVAQHRERRNAAALDDDVALSGIFDTTHRAHAVFQAAAQPEPLVSELIEETQKGPLDCRGGARAAEGRDVLDRALADLAPVFAGTALELRIEFDRTPVGESYNFV